MPCACCSPTDATARQFDEAKLRKELASYHKGGPGPTTRGLLAELGRLAEPPKTMLDVGSGIGALTIGMLKAGTGRAVCVDISPASLTVSAEEARREGVFERMEFRAGDFVAIGQDLPAADLVTLDRVVCCYPAFDALLEQAAGHSLKVLAFSYPRDRWWVRLAIGIENAWRMLRGNRFRAFVHSPSAMAAVLRKSGFQQLRSASTWTWQIEVHTRS